jgi:hypothetical protein
MNQNRTAKVTISRAKFFYIVSAHTSLDTCLSQTKESGFVCLLIQGLDVTLVQDTRFLKVLQNEIWWCDNALIRYHS